MTETTQQAGSGRRFRNDPANLEGMYFRGIQPGAAAPTIAGRAELIFGHHRELAATRRPGTAITRVYRPNDGSELGPAIQIVNDDMPLLVDSVTSALRRLGVTPAEVIHPVFDVLRDEHGRLQSVAPREGSTADGGRGASNGHAAPESWIHVQLGTTVGDEVLDHIERILPRLLAEIRQVATDTSAMLTAMLTLAGRLDRASVETGDVEARESARLLRWLADGHFTTLGYGYYRPADVPDSDPRQSTDSGLGVLRHGAPGDIGTPAADPAGSVLRLSNGSLDSLLPGSPDAYVVSIADRGGEDAGGVPQAPGAYSARATESELAVVYFTVHRSPGAAPADISEPNRERIQELLFAATRTWADRLLAEAAGIPAISAVAAAEYALAFPAGYQQEREPARALADLQRLQYLGAGEIDADVYRDAESPSGDWRFALYVAGEEVSLSRVLPVLHSLGVEVVDERPYRLDLPDGSQRWIYDFGLRVPAASLRSAVDQDLESSLIRQTDGESVPGNNIRQRIRDAFAAMWFGRTEVDGLNELVLRAGLHWRQIAMLRAYTKYLRQAGFAYTGANITRVLLSHPAMTRTFTELFGTYFDPDSAHPLSALYAAAIEERLQAQINAVVSLDTDRILRAILALITATLRTNYYRLDDIGRAPEQLSFKFDSRTIDELPRPRPQFEIFVYSPRVEGVHLRFGAVARGGLRWSDRLEDFRTEVLGLVKAQAVKNAVIVPGGAKGGFVVKRPPAHTGDPAADRRALQAEGVACYRTFISGLLDLTDNIDHATGDVVPPERVVRRDGDDTYLVVAADKGTATFSDIANDVARRYGFWLGDAFASGGSIGYDHKAMGITAKGAWESVKRHFAELDIDTHAQDFSVVGVGDMSGDVFGNGMLLSEHIRLVAAFDHRHIFLDPNPDAASSFAERSRMFALPRSSWADYDTSLISAGGGVYDRSGKVIPVSPQVRAALGLDPSVVSLSPPEMIKAILLAPVDLLWNGGIGTYIKASSESHADAGDKSNDAVRVDAKRVRARVIGEGGNLGATALGRIEFCGHGGRMNTDALDNSAGVDCSDHEVNIKVLLDAVISSGELAAADRAELLAEMTDEVSALVLRDNVSQNFCMGLARAESAPMLTVHRRLIAELESRHGLDRRLEALPSDAELDQRAAQGIALTSPELANLLAHVKLSLKSDLLRGDLLDGSAFAQVLPAYFPAQLCERFGAAIGRHPLRRQILATMVVNDMVDYGGITYAFRLAEETGATTDDAIRAFTAAAEIFDLHSLWQRIRTTPMPTAVRDELELETKRTLDRASRWLLANRPQPIAIGADIARYRAGVRALAAQVPAWQPGPLAQELLRRSKGPIDRGAPPELAEEVYLLIHRFSLLDVLDIADITRRDAGEVTALYYALDNHFEIQRLLHEVVGLDRGDRWRTLARLAVRDDLYDALRSLTFDVLSMTEPADSAVEKIVYWESTNRFRLARARAALTEILASESKDLTTLSVAARQVRSLVGSSEAGAVAVG